MSNIDLKRFVNINIQKYNPSLATNTRDTVILYTAEGNDNTPKIINSLSEAITTYPSDSYPNTFAYLNVYFNNGGLKVKVIEKTNYSNLTNDIIDKLNNSEICVIYAAPKENISDVYSKLKELAKYRMDNINKYYGINEKILITNCTNSNFNDKDLIKNFAVKYSSIQGGEMAIAAYLSKIDVYGINTVFDYAFTVESLSGEDIDNDTFGTINKNNINVDIKLAGQNRNTGGNLKDGKDLVNEYVRVIMHQTLTDVLIQLLSQKIKNSRGISKIYSTITQELENYKTCGYLTTDKIWTYDDYTIEIGPNTYTIIEKGTPLQNGYYVTVLPLSSLTESQKLEHSTPNIYVIIADQYGIRKITINGEVI